MPNTAALILAAGQGTRMKSNYPKVVHKVCGYPMVQYVIDSSLQAGVDKCIVITGFKAQEVEKQLKGPIDFVRQDEQLGTGHAVIQAHRVLADFKGDVVVLNGDIPLITSHTIKEMLIRHKENSFDCCVLTAEIPDPTGYGRIVRDERGNIKRIVEEKDATKVEKHIKEINSGVYVFNAQKLFEALKALDNNNEQGEYYLTDVIEIIKNRGGIVGGFKLDDHTEIKGINNRVQLAEVSEIMRNRILQNLMLSGVTIQDPQNTYIEKEVVVGRDTVVYPGTHLEGKTSIGEDCRIGPHCRIKDSRVEDRVEITYSVVVKSLIKTDSRVGPFAYIRPDSVIGKHVKIGDFVEIKKSKVGDYTKISHLAYVGDARIGEEVNLGAGVIIVNYDGHKKHQTVIHDKAFVGCNTNLISPVNIGKGSYIAAGSTITDNVPEDSLAIARSRQVIKKGWPTKKRKEWEGKQYE